MDKISYFDFLPNEVLFKILDDARNPNSRLVCKRFNILFDDVCKRMIWNSLKKEENNIELNNRILNVETSLSKSNIKGFHLLGKFFDSSKIVKFNNIENEAREFQNFLDVNFSRFFGVQIGEVPRFKQKLLSEETQELAAKKLECTFGNTRLETLPKEMMLLSNMEILELYENELSMIDLSHFLKLKEIKIFYNKNDLCVKVAGLENLEKFSITGDKGIISIDLSHLTNLRELIINEGAGKYRLKKLDISHLLNLRTIDISCGELQKIDFSNLVCLEEMKVSCLKMKELDISNCTQLKKVDIVHLDKAPNLSKLTNLTHLRLYLCNDLLGLCLNTLSKLEQLDLERYLYHNNKKAISLNFSNNNNLKSLIIKNQKVSEIIGLSGPTKLQKLSLISCGLKSIDVSSLKCLKNLNLSFNKIRLLDIPQSMRFKEFSAMRNPWLFLPEYTLVKMNSYARPMVSKYMSSQMNYPAETPLGQIYKNILLNWQDLDSQESRKTLAALFNQLPEEEQRKIFEIVRQVEGKEMFRFAVAVQKRISKKLKSLSYQDKDSVYGKVYHLTAQNTGLNSDMRSNKYWGQYHTKDNLVLLADALSK